MIDIHKHPLTGLVALYNLKILKTHSQDLLLCIYLKHRTPTHRTCCCVHSENTKHPLTELVAVYILKTLNTHSQNLLLYIYLKH